MKKEINNRIRLDISSGIFKTESQDTYLGQFRNGIPHGRGILLVRDGAYYTGKWKKGRFHGNGTFKSPHGITYSGQWKNGKMHCKSAYLNTLISKYVDKWNNELVHGKGKFIYVYIINKLYYCEKRRHFRLAKKNHKGNNLYTIAWSLGKECCADISFFPKGKVNIGNVKKDSPDYQVTLFGSYGEIMYSTDEAGSGDAVLH